MWRPFQDGKEGYVTVAGNQGALDHWNQSSAQFNQAATRVLPELNMITSGILFPGHEDGDIAIQSYAFLTGGRGTVFLENYTAYAAFQKSLTPSCLLFKSRRAGVVENQGSLD